MVDMGKQPLGWKIAMRVLLIEENDSVRATVFLLLETAGFEVVEACDAKEGLHLYRSVGADVVLTDLFMPGEDGLHVIRELRREFPGVKVVVMSGGFGGKVNMLPIARML